MSQNTMVDTILETIDICIEEIDTNYAIHILEEVQAGISARLDGLRVDLKNGDE